MKIPQMKPLMWMSFIIMAPCMIFLSSLFSSSMINKTLSMTSLKNKNVNKFIFFI